MTLRQQIERLRELLIEPTLIDVERSRAPAGTTWVLVLSCNRCVSCDHPWRLPPLPGSALRHPRRLEQRLRLNAEMTRLPAPVSVSASDGRAIVRLLHEFCDAKEAGCGDGN